MPDQIADVAAGRKGVVKQHIEVDTVEWPTVVGGGFANESILSLSACIRSHNIVFEEVEVREKMQRSRVWVGQRGSYNRCQPLDDRRQFCEARREALHETSVAVVATVVGSIG